MIATKRGAFILFEGIDRSGKTTQCTRLVEHLKQQGAKVRDASLSCLSYLNPSQIVHAGGAHAIS